MSDELTEDFSLDEVAAAMKMSPRWVRDRCKFDGVEHLRYGHKIRFTPEQVEKFRAAHVKAPASESITTGRKKAGK